MKIRDGFISNSSSTAYIIINTTKTVKYLEDLVQECGEDLVKKWNKEYGKYERLYTFEDLLHSVQDKPMSFEPGKNVVVNFGDHAGPYAYTPMGVIGDYCLRNGKKTKSFKVVFKEMER